jgi:hypothetical protein
MTTNPLSSIIMAFFFGLGLAAIGTAVFMQGHVATTLRAIDHAYIVAWEKTTSDAYRNESPETAAWALQKFIDLLTARLQDADPNKYRESIQQYLVLAYGRSAYLAKQAGNLVAYKKNMASALELAGKLYPHAITTDEELFRFLDRKKAL